MATKTEKAAATRVAKIVEDKTFGLKNKNKSKKIQQYIAQVEKGAMSNIKPPKGNPAETKVVPKVDPKVAKAEAQRMLAERKKMREEEEMKKAEEEEKSRSRVAVKIDFYTDLRDIRAKEKNEELVPRSKRVCEHFLKAIENKVFGHRWACPNGDKCNFSHCLPEGYVIDQIDKPDNDNAISFEFWIDDRREQLRESGKTLVPITFEEFQKWNLINRPMKVESGVTGIEMFKNLLGKTHKNEAKPNPSLPSDSIVDSI